MKRKQFYLVNLMVFLGLFMGAQNFCVGLDVGVAEPVPGFQLGHDVAFNYVTPDASFMLLQVWDPVWRIKSSTWDANLQQWTPPQELPTDPPGGFPNWTMIASLSPDGMTMYYGDGIQGGVCLSRKTEYGWTIPPGLAELVPNLDPAPSSTYFNGKFFYTTHFYNDIWFSTYDAVNDEFSPSVPVESINTSEWSEQGPWISHDNTLLVFSSDRPGGYGGYDLYSATWDKNLQKWGNITNLGLKVNTPLDEYCPNIAEEAGLLFFDRYQPSTNLRQLMQAVVEPVEPDIDVSPLSHDFGDVELGTSRTVIVTISNMGNDELNVSGIGLETDFAITSGPAASIVVEPNQTVDVEITYTPSVLGYNSAVLKITSDDPDEPVVEVQLSATGVEIPPPPSEQIANILAFFDTSVDGGTLVGDGPGSSAEKRLNALRNMVEAAGSLIDDELSEEACQQLLDVYRRMDGQPSPPDFVKGEAVTELATMIQELMTTLGCE